MYCLPNRANCTHPPTSEATLAQANLHTICYGSILYICTLYTYTYLEFMFRPRKAAKLAPSLCSFSHFFFFKEIHIFFR